jgi:hypothetical protein
MATKRKGPAKRAAGRKQATARRQGTRRRATRHGARTGSREARREEVARAVEPPHGVPDLHVAAPVDVPMRAPEPAEPAFAGGDGVPGYARLIARSDAARAARADAQAELSRRREEAEREAAAGAARPEDVPGFRDVGVELALAALRLFRTIFTAPLRIGLAFLRPREAMM